MDLTDVYSEFHPATAQYTFFSVVHKTSSKMEHILGHKAGLNKYKEIEITPCLLSNHNTIKLEFNNKRNNRKYSNTWKLNNTLLHDQWVIKNRREKIEGFLKFNESENTTYQIVWDSAKAVIRGKFIAMNAYVGGNID
jgi:hypothetical protein